MLRLSFKKLVAIKLLLFVITINAAEDNRNHKKRQIYREQVLPHAGGRIPDAAFETERLFLNRLQKEGIAIPDGVVLEQRNPQVYPYYNRAHRIVFRIALSSDNRFIGKNGRYQYNEVPTVETTYLYPQIHGEKTVTRPEMPAHPIYKQIQLHNTQLNQLKFQPKKKAQHQSKEPLKPLKTTSYQNFNLIHDHHRNHHLNHRLNDHHNQNILNTPLATTTKLNILGPSTFFDLTDNHFLSNYGNGSPFNEFNHYFHNFDLYQPNPNGDHLFNKDDHTIDLPITGFNPNPAQLLY